MVIVFVLLSMLLAIWASRTAWFNELVVGNDADYQRAFEAAQALIQDAEFDIRGETATGLMCKFPCRRYNRNAEQFPTEAKEINILIAKLEKDDTKCQDGLCARRVGRQDFWNYDPDASPDASKGEVAFNELAKPGVGARYGTYSGAKSTNPILSDTSAHNKGGWYWIEIIPYVANNASSNLIIDLDRGGLPLHLDVYVVYRITAIAYGLKDNTKVVLQETYARQKLQD